MGILDIWQMGLVDIGTDRVCGVDTYQGIGSVSGIQGMTVFLGVVCLFILGI